MLKCFVDQIECDFDSELIELQQKEQLDLTSTSIDKVKQQLAEELTCLENNLNSSASSENHRVLLVLLIGIACLLVN